MYAGITSEWINPSFISNSPYICDFNLVTADVYSDNNYLYLYPTNVPDLLDDWGKNTPKIDNAEYKKHGSWSKYLLEDKDNNSWRKNAYVSVLAQGPSLMLSVKKWNFAFEDAARAAVSVVGISKNGAKLVFENTTYIPLQNKDLIIPRARANAAVWDEYGITAARDITNNHDWAVKGGITLKHINGYAGGYCLNKGIDISVPNDSTLYFKKLSAKFGYAANLNNPATVCGKGASTDLGVTIEKKTIKNTYQCPNFCDKQLELQYLWKLGFSLIDIGYIHFNENTNNYVIDNSTDYWVNFSKIKTKGVNGFDSLMKAHFSNLITSNNDFTMMLPWAASMQFNYNIGYNLYINGTWVQRIPHFGLPGIDRVNSISITPMYDTRRFGVAMPFVFYQYMWPRIGVAFRFNNFLVIGTDKIGAFIGQQLSGEDLYISLKINFLKKCKKHKRRSMPSFLPDLNFSNQHHFKKN
jgi:hypothetical protein